MRGKQRVLNSGDVFNNWTVVSLANSRNRNTYYMCKCKCGTTSEIMASKLVLGKTKQCRKCQLSQITGADAKMHGMSKTRIYETWNAMVDRTTKPHSHNYKNYGDRGITICKEWKENFMNFYNWAMENGYQENLTIDRIDNDGNYEPDNCRWATIKQQSNNKRNTIKIEHDGKTLSLLDWANHFNIKYQLAWQRYKKGWEFDDIFSKQRYRGVRIKYAADKTETRKIY